MEVLKLNQEVLTLLWILPLSDDESKWLKLRNFFISLIVFLLGLVTVVCGSFFFVRNVDNNLEMSLSAVIQISACTSQVYMLFFSIILWKNFAKLFPNLQKIYDECKCIESFASFLSQ